MASHFQPAQRAFIAMSVVALAILWAYLPALAATTYTGAGSTSGPIPTIQQNSQAISLSTVSHLAMAWQYAPAVESPVHVAPCVTRAVVYAAIGSSVHALDAQTGQVVWERDLDARPGPAASKHFITASPVLSGNDVCVGTDDGVVHFLDAASGVDAGQISLDGCITGAPLLLGNSLFCGTNDGAICRLDVTAAPHFQVRQIWANWASPHDPIRGHVGMNADLIFAGTEHGRLFALDPGTGKTVAQSYFNMPDDHPGPLVTTRSILFGGGDTLYSLTPANLHLQWQQRFTSPLATSLATGDDRVFATTWDGSLYALDTETGAESWAVGLGPAASARTHLAVASDVLLASGGQGGLFAFSALGSHTDRGQILWQYTTPDAPARSATHPWIAPDLAAAPTISGDRLVVISDNGVVTCLSLTAEDIQGPTVDLRYPAGGPYLAGEATSIVARVQDRESGYRRKSLRLYLDGQPVTGYRFYPESGRLEYQPPSPFSPGQHSIEVVATDNRGNVSHRSWTFTVGQAASGARRGMAVFPSPVPPVDSYAPGRATPSSPWGHVPTFRPATPAEDFHTGPVREFWPNYLSDLKDMTRWAQFPITVAFVKDSEYTRTRERAACAGFDCWVQATHGLISYRLTSNQSNADLTVRFDATKSDGLTYTESMNGMNRRGNMSLGVAMPNHEDGEMPMDDLSCVAAHEFGHALGINGHSKNPLDLMYREHSIGEPWSISDRDLNTLKTDYSALFSEGSAAHR